MTHVTTGSAPTHTQILGIHSAKFSAHVQSDIQAIETHQLADNALSMARWYHSRGEPAKALARLRRAQSHIKTAMQGGAQ
jgi:outer membrane protein assembly factor BamD (BamD/ComL family)